MDDSIINRKLIYHTSSIEDLQKLIDNDINNTEKILVTTECYKCGTGTNEFYETEYRLWGLTREKYWAVYKQNSPKCPCCGTARGFSFGTGDCGCDVGYTFNNPYQE